MELLSLEKLCKVVVCTVDSVMISVFGSQLLSSFSIFFCNAMKCNVMYTVM